MVRLPRNLIARARAEDGIFLVEIMVSCLILAIVLMGLVAALDTAGKASGTSKERAIAADLAQGDLDTLRSKTYASLRKLLEADVSPPPVEVEGVKYMLSRDSSPASQSELAKSCSNAVSRDVVRVTTKVSWTGMGNAKPVQMTTLIASPVGASGSVVVKIVRNDGKPLSGISGSLSGQGGATTDGNGCARWDDVPPGDSYELLMHKEGFVQPDGTPTITQSIDVSIEQTVTLQYEYDQAAQVGPRFIYRWPGTTDRRWRTDGNPQFVTIAHARLNGGQRVFTLGDPHETLVAPGTKYNVNPPSSSWDVTSTNQSVVYMVPNLYPFDSAYSGWPDQCPSAKGGEYGALSAPLPRGFFYKPADFKMPGMDLRVRQGANTKPSPGVAGMRIKSPCGTEWEFDVNTPVPIDTNRLTIPRLGFPYNEQKYKICAFHKADKTKWDRNDQANTTPSITTPTPIHLQYDKAQNANEAQCGNDW